eukprot:gb/GFBE01000102.1/.p1 GENE.gb/GFBE01000102.1/~~gb/GFBE01000102.1/.p1  ORF type:complete len:290 (+),score=66.88 gb/GFBE01000102.1/:1-870(+)
MASASSDRAHRHCDSCFAGLRRLFRWPSATSSVVVPLDETAVSPEVLVVERDPASKPKTAPEEQQPCEQFGSNGRQACSVQETVVEAKVSVPEKGLDEGLQNLAEPDAQEAASSFFVDMRGDDVSTTACKPKAKPKAKRRSAAEPEGLRRFTVPQKSIYPRALREINAGKKETCWMWHMIPTPPYMVNGVEKGSARNQKYALRSDEEVRAYLRFEADGVNLRENYLGIMQAIKDQLAKGVKVRQLIGVIDEPKLRSSAKLFERVARGLDAELHEVLLDVLRLLREKPDD